MNLTYFIIWAILAFGIIRLIIFSTKTDASKYVIGSCKLPKQLHISKTVGDRELPEGEWKDYIKIARNTPTK